MRRATVDVGEQVRLYCYHCATAAVQNVRTIVLRQSDRSTLFSSIATVPTGFLVNRVYDVHMTCNMKYNTYANKPFLQFRRARSSRRDAVSTDTFPFSRENKQTQKTSEGSRNQTFSKLVIKRVAIGLSVRTISTKHFFYIILEY